MTKRVKKVAKQVVVGKGKDAEGRYDGSIENSTMYPVTCRDGLFQYRFNAEEKAKLVARSVENECKMAELFTIMNRRFRELTRCEIKNMVLSQVSEKTGNNFRSVAQYVKEYIIR